MTVTIYKDGHQIITRDGVHEVKLLPAPVPMIVLVGPIEGSEPIFIQVLAPGIGWESLSEPKVTV